MNGPVELFQPGYAYRGQERDRRPLGAQIPRSDAAPGAMDLAAGIARITVPGPTQVRARHEIADEPASGPASPR